MVNKHIIIREKHYIDFFSFDDVTDCHSVTDQVLPSGYMGCPVQPVLSLSHQPLLLFPAAAAVSTCWPDGVGARPRNAAQQSVS